MEAFEKNALILPNLPNKAFCGIDLLSFTTNPRFAGVKHLPQGWHFVFVAANHSHSIRHGAWFQVKNIPELYVKEWDATTEELNPRNDRVTSEQWQGRLAEIWRDRLTPYRQSVPQASNEDEVQDEEDLTIEERNHWSLLTDYITEELLARITGITDATTNHFSLTSASSAKQDFDVIPGLSVSLNGAASESVLGLLPINLKHTWRDGAVGRERTEAAQDRSWAFRQLVQVHCNGNSDELLGEAQFCFLMVLTLNNYSCLEQWKRILGLLLTCVDAVVEEAEFFARVLKLLRMQLEYSLDAEGSLLDLSEEGGSLLKQWLGRFRKGLEDVENVGDNDAMKELEQLEEYMEAEHGWSLNTDYVRRGHFELEDGEQVELDLKGTDKEYETGEYGPTVVDLTPYQIQQLSEQTDTRLPMSSKTQSQSDMFEEEAPEDMDERF